MIEYQNVSKFYGDLAAVDGISLDIPDGEFFGLLGPNGAGKTTIIRMTTALTAVSSGAILIDGEPINRDLSKTKQRFGVVPQYTNLEAEISARQNLDYHGRLYGMDTSLRKSKIDELLEFAELSDRADDKASSYSSGMRRRLMIIKALMHSPDVLFLDEPTVGLDATARRNIWDLLRNMNSQGLTIFLTTHYLEEAQALCSRVGLIDKGKMVQLDSPSALIASHGNYILEYFKDGEMVYQFFNAREEAVKASEWLNASFQVREANLEDVFVALTNRRIAES
ncbi:MAG: ABC transporter ATP-binding protein [Eubacteriaceae bacterium]|nr:ABC transporter ATP-binding protein [Eubacteriaceae bacterium]